MASPSRVVVHTCSPIQLLITTLNPHEQTQPHNGNVTHRRPLKHLTSSMTLSEVSDAAQITNILLSDRRTFTGNNSTEH